MNSQNEDLVERNPAPHAAAPLGPTGRYWSGVVGQEAHVDWQARAQAAEAALAERTAERDAERNNCLDAETQFLEHTEAVGKFLSELYCTMIDPCSSGEIGVNTMCARLIEAAKAQREQLARGPADVG